MSILLSDIKLDFEALANDPIEVGIHYGKSVLQVLSNKITKPLVLLDQMSERYSVDALSAVKVTPKIAKVVHTRNAIIQPPNRVSFRRNFEQVQTSAYVQRRNLVGSL